MTSASMAAPGSVLCGLTAPTTSSLTSALIPATPVRGEGGDLVVFEPVVGQVYGYGQENYRGGRSMVCFAKWNGSGFVCCDKLGRELKWDGSGFVRCDKLGRGLKA